MFNPNDNDFLNAKKAKDDGICQGDCAECTDQLALVHVTHPTHDWGWFSYCENAIAEDKSRGLIVATISGDIIK